MKCLILAGGRGERLWPLSRKNYPKQFIQVQKNHSMFQETVARNLPYCDEFIIITNSEYKDIISNQMSAFQGVPYRCMFEEEPRKTTAALTLTCMSLQPSEFVFAVSADHLIDTEECEGSYKDTIMKAKEYASNGKIVLFGKETADIDNRFGYFFDGVFYEKPDRKTVKSLSGNEILQNIGLAVFQNGVFLNEMKKLQKSIFDQCKQATKKREGISEGVLYPSKVLRTIYPIAIEKSIYEKTDKLYCVKIGFSWSDVGSLDDLEKTEYIADGIGVTHESANSVIINQSPKQAVVVNDLDNVLVVNTTDAVYIGRRGKSPLLKGILHDNPRLERFSDKGVVTYRKWGYYEQIVEENKYRIRRVTILPGKTIYEHKHEERMENWTIIRGKALITLDGIAGSYSETDTIVVEAGTAHRISNNGETELILIETAVGDVLHGGDILSEKDSGITETDLGMVLEPMVKLSPVFRDYLWGGTKLRDIYGKHCDYDVIAESWELSAHNAGNSVVASGRHKGMSFGRYLETVGSEVLGWKCSPLQAFPLLLKFIDANKNLSVQVHPNDDYALENENEYGKNEMWYVVDSEPGAGLFVGFKRDVTPKEVKKRIADDTILDILNFYPTKPGDVFFIPAGTVHAIGAGNMICEIQQSSNITYRLYDYNRKDKFGNPRELHLEKALEVMDCYKYRPVDFDVEQEDSQQQIRCKYFEATIISIDGDKKISMEDDSFRAVVCISGRGELSIGDKKQTINAGECIFVPANNNLMNVTGSLSLIVTKV